MTEEQKRKAAMVGKRKELEQRKAKIETFIMLSRGINTLEHEVKLARIGHEIAVLRKATFNS